ncbi:acyl-CoA thioesterase [Streptomyces sp. KR80]|uniref:acyl-CoA thioesterase n=1 Tax=Streptomyces sp. KR80 TaxID=3457426 RepID=UPI003FD249E8
MTSSSETGGLSVVGFLDDVQVSGEANRWRGNVAAGWEAHVGANGGYVAALALKALIAASGKNGWQPRSLSIHFAAPASPGPLTAETTVEHSGRRTTTLTARLVQQAQTVLTAACTLAPGDAFEAAPFTEAVMPEVPAPEQCDLLPVIDGMTPPFFGNFIYRPALGDPPFSGAQKSQTASWIRPAIVGDRPPEPSDGPALLTALSDAWLPAMYTRFSKPAAMATLSLSVYVRTDPGPLDSWRLVAADTALSEAGLCDQNITIWGQDGVLLAQARQLCALIKPRKREAS